MIDKNSNLNIAIVDDHYATRDGYRNQLHKWDFVKHVKTFDSIIDFKIELKINQFDLLFLDIELNGENGLDACKNLKQTHPNMKIIILSTFHSEEYILNAYEFEADGYLFKDALPKDLKQAIETVIVKDDRYFNSEAIEKIFKFNESVKKKAKKGKVELSEREKQILKYMCQGKTNPEISKIIGRTPATIASHRQNIMNKINAHNAYEVMNYALDHGLYNPYIKNVTKK